MSKTNIGKMACETCGNTVTVKQNENGTLSYRCDECDAAPYAKTGTMQNEHWRSKLVSLTKNDAQEAPKNDLNQGVDTDTSTNKEQTKPKGTGGFFGLEL